MKNLLEEFGQDHFVNRVVGCSLMFDGNPCYTFGVDDYVKNVKARSISGTPEKIVSKEILIPVDFFTSETCLKHPQLGYRTAAKGQYIGYYYRVPTAVKKGLHMSQVKINVHPMTAALDHMLGFDHYFYQENLIKTFMAFKPEIISLQDGIKQVKNKEILSFIVDQNFLCVPSLKPDKYLMDIYHRERMIGHIGKDDSIKITADHASTAWKQVTEGKKV